MIRALALALVLGCLACTTPADTSAPAPAPAPRFEPAQLMPARVRKLSNAEYASTVRALLDLDVDLRDRLPPDVRVDGFTQNDANPVQSAWASRAQALALELAARFVREHPQRVSCAGELQRCAQDFIEALGPRAFRRPLEAHELEALTAIYLEAAEHGGAPQAARWVVAALLQSPSLLYLSEAGAPTDIEGVTRLTPYEAAASLSYSLRGTPPDDALTRAAASGAILDADERRRQALRLLALSDTRHHFRRFVREWLEVDLLEHTAKSRDTAPRYESLKHEMLDETHAYVDEVFVHRGASLRALLDAGFVSVEPDIARYYGLEVYGPRVPSLRIGRPGILQQASFLSAHAHPDGTSPVLRGDFVLRRLLCIELPRPEEVGIETVMPPPTHTLTTRERFAAHVQNPGCRGCHDAIDPLGFAFEEFDAAGKQRREENGRPIDTAGSFERAGLRANFDDSAQLTRWLAGLPETEACFQRYAFRFFTSTSDPALDASFELIRRTLPEQQRANLLANLVAYVTSDLFLYRRSDDHGEP